MGTIQPRIFPAIVLFLWVAALGGCGWGEAPQYVSMGTAPVGGTFPVVGGALAEVLNAHPGDIHWKVQIRGSKGTQENIRRLASGEFELGMANAAISYFAVRGESGWEKRYDVQTVATLSPLVAMFATRADSGIRKIGDLKGRRVVIGPAGAGFAMFVRPILKEHGLEWEDFTQLYAPQGVAVDLMADGAADAAFLGGGLPAPSISQAKSSFNVYLVPFEPKALRKLLNPEKYPFFKPMPHKIMKAKYPDLMKYPLEKQIREMDQEELTEFVSQRQLGVDTSISNDLDAEARKKKLESLRNAVVGKQFGWLNVGSMQIITHKNTDEKLVKEITRTIWENRRELAKKHGVFKFLEMKTIPIPGGKWKVIQGAAMSTGIEFHKGAAEFYRDCAEIGFLPNEANLAPKKIQTAVKIKKE